MLRLMEMLRRVLADRVVAAANVAASQAETKVYPAHPGSETLLTTFSCARRDVADLREVRALIGHESLRGRGSVGSCSSCYTRRSCSSESSSERSTRQWAARSSTGERPAR